MSGNKGDEKIVSRRPKVLPDVALITAAFLTVLALAPMSSGHAFTALPPPELIALSKGAFSPALDACQSAWLSYASLTGSSPSYFNASLGPNFSAVPELDRPLYVVLAVAAAGMVAMNLALLRHFRGVLAITRK